MARKYELRARADKQQATRQRIVESILTLHMEVGPANTTISAIAERAGVERLTVYRHFPTELSMFQACGAHWRQLHPRPPIEEWTAADPAARLETALTQLYRFYEETEAMSRNILRDEQVLPDLAGVANFRGWLDRVADRLCAAWPEDKRTEVRPAIALVTAFASWEMLVKRCRLDRDAAVALAVRMVRCCSD
jgi:AcrR family transcriptional regulator